MTVPRMSYITGQADDPVRVPPYPRTHMTVTTHSVQAETVAFAQARRVTHLADPYRKQADVSRPPCGPPTPTPRRAR